MDIQHLEKLARLSLTETERAEMQGDLTKILAMMAQLTELELDEAAPLVYLSDENAPLRDDIVLPHLDREKALQNAPMRDEQYFKVPKVIEK